MHISEKSAHNEHKGVIFLNFIHVILTSLLSLVVLFLLTKLMGNKQISQLNMFDYVTGITIGSIAAEMATEIDRNPIEGITAMAIYAGIGYLLSYTTSKWVAWRKIVVGRPILLYDNGKLYRENLKKARLDISDFLALCRCQGQFDLSQLRTVILEANGALSILLRSDFHPATPNDLSLQVREEALLTNVILDGHIMSKNLKRTGNNETWLKKQLQTQGYSSEKEVFLACCDKQNNLSVYPMIRERIELDPFE